MIKWKIQFYYNTVFGNQLVKNRPDNATRAIKNKFLLSIFLTLR